MICLKREVNIPFTQNTETLDSYITGAYIGGNGKRRFTWCTEDGVDKDTTIWLFTRYNDESLVDEVFHAYNDNDRKALFILHLKT